VLRSDDYLTSEGAFSVVLDDDLLFKVLIWS
jgi:hypothetical protein